MPPELPDNPLPRLRQIREQKKAASELDSERDALIRHGAKRDYTQAELALAAGVDPSRVGQIVRSRS
jgi:hypothetical protein